MTREGVPDPQGFRTYHLPGEAPGTVGWGEAGSSSDRGFVDWHPSQGNAVRLIDRLVKGREGLFRRPVGRLLPILGRAGRRFLDRKDSLTRVALELLPLDSGLSPAASAEVLRGMARDWTEDALHRLVHADFPDPDVLDRFVEQPSGERLRAVGDRLAVHLVSGTVPGVGATSLLRSLLVKTPVLLKPGRGDRVLPVLLARAVAEEDPALGACLGVVYWPGGSGEVEPIALARAERVVIYGGGEAVASIRSRLTPQVPLVVYPHRISLGMVAREKLADLRSARVAARHAARAISAYDQRGCVSPQLIWVERGGAVAPVEWSALLGAALERFPPAVAPGERDRETAAVVQQLRALAELRAATGRGDAPHLGGNLSWTVLTDPDPALSASPLGRTILVKPLDDLDEVPALLAPHRLLLQSVALEADAQRRETLARALADSGVTRITSFRRQAWPPAWWRHDGSGPLDALVRWVTLESPRRPPAGPSTGPAVAPNAR